MELEQIKQRWNNVLDLLLEEDRIAWLAFFDARLVSFEDNQLTLDFSDSQKFANSHDFKKNHVILTTLSYLSARLKQF